MTAEIKRLFAITLLTCLFYSPAGFAEENAKKNSFIAHIQLKGMTCSGCVKGISAKLKKNKAYKNFTVSLERQAVYIEPLKQKKFNEKEIKNFYEKMGYKFKGISYSKDMPFEKLIKNLEKEKADKLKAKDTEEKAAAAETTNP